MGQERRQQENHIDHQGRFTAPMPYHILECNDLLKPFETIRDYVSTMRQQCQEGGRVLWPPKHAFQKSLEVALTLLPLDTC